MRDKRALMGSISMMRGALWKLIKWQRDLRGSTKISRETTTYLRGRVNKI
jgi:hypothetical protein